MDVNKGRVPPGRGSFQSGGYHILADVVHRIAEWITHHRLERAAVDLPGLPAQQECIGLRHRLKEMNTNLVVPIRLRPATVRKATFSVFIRATRRLDDTIQVRNQPGSVLSNIHRH